MKSIERYRGSLLGLAVGDALGAPLESKPPSTFKPIENMTGGGMFNLSVGQWTDDTSLALCLAESLIKTKRFDPLDQMKRYLKWYKEGHLSSTGKCFGIGSNTLQSLQQFEKTGKLSDIPTNSNATTNGSLMRLAPVPLAFSSDLVRAIERSKDSSKTTHGAQDAVDSCGYMGALIVGALNGFPKAELLSDHYCPVKGYWKEHPLSPPVDEVAAGSFKVKEPPQIKGAQYVVRSLEAAIWAFYKTDSFKEGCLLAVNLGDDADTTGAIYGQLAGAYYGEQGIPTQWLDELAYRELIGVYAEQLMEIV
ncbi:MAG TPA: ADP-ribosylglycohydrolase family protein [Methanosarcinaceae archaeon]|nr:ADP-ribosylglycohydrolase family protein [Methanosarcinaceae archaeon]